MLRTTISALGLALVLGTAANAATHTYDLNGSYADSLGGNSLVAQGGTLDATGYTFGGNQGLTLDLSGIIAGNQAYTIETRFYFDNLAAESFRKIIDFKEQASDNGMYTYARTSSFYPTAGGSDDVFSVGVYATLRLSRSAAGLVSISVDGADQPGYDDFGLDYAVFSTGVANFFIDDFEVGGENSSGRVDYISITTGNVPEPTTWAMMLLGFGGLGFALRRRRDLTAAA